MDEFNLWSDAQFFSDADGRVPAKPGDKVRLVVCPDGERFVAGNMDEHEFWSILVEFFRDEMKTDPIGVGDWLAQGGVDVDKFVGKLNRLYPPKQKE